MTPTPVRARSSIYTGVASVARFTSTLSPAKMSWPWPISGIITATARASSPPGLSGYWTTSAGKRALKVSRYIPKGASVLDIGCGNGNFLKCLIEAGYKGFGLELPGNSLERAKRVPGIKLKEGRLQQGDFDEASFDMVTLWHVFEHLNEPLKNLSVIADILKPGGYLILSLPNIESWQGRVFGKHWFHLDPPRHLFYLGPQALTLQLNALGFNKVHESFFSLEQNPFGMQQSILNGLLAHREVLYEALKGRSGGGKGYSGPSIALQKLFYMSTFPGFAALSVIEAMFKRGGTMELVFRKED